jgi:16S rRNA (uracil1498-N3)-methyltransferase
VRSSAYLPVFFGELPADGELVQLTGDEGAHAVRVRRMRVGEGIRIADTDGGFADCEIVEVSGRSLRAKIVARGSEPEPRPRIVVAQALPKGDRGTLAVELMTEAGVDEIIPWQAATCVSRWADPQKADKGRLRWLATAREAAKQSRRSRVPLISAALDTALLAERIDGRVALLLHESTATPIAQARVDGADEIILIVGPEGGITAAEIATLSSAGAQPVRLGPEVLRTSTAGVVAVSWVAARCGRWG